jgi:PadR family transcriptional regulator, regulatory protein PadR
MPKRAISYTVAVILQTIENGYRYGFDIMDVTGLPSGTVYPALRRLEDSGFVESAWETLAEPNRVGPPRKFYTLTAEGRTTLAEALARYRLLDGRSPLLPKTDPAPDEG